MLVIARKVGQTILIGDNIEITISAVRGDQVRLAIQAPREISVVRREVAEQVGAGNQAAIETADNALIEQISRALSSGLASTGDAPRKVSLGRSSASAKDSSSSPEPPDGEAA